MICVYGLGPEGTGAGAGAGSADGRINAPVAPSPGREVDLEGMAASAGVGVGCDTGTNGGGAVTAGGGGLTKIGACGDKLWSFGADGTGNGSTADGITPPGGDALEWNAGWGFSMSLNSPVKLDAGALLAGALSG